MNDTERTGDWLRFYQAARLKMNALLAVYENEGEKGLKEVLQRAGLVSASDVVKACRNDWTR